MLDVFQLTMSKVGMLLIFIAIGYIMRRHHDLPDDAGRVLSLLCTLLFSPAYSISNLSKNFTMDVLLEKTLIVGYGCIFVVLCIGLSLVLSKPFGKTRMERNSLIYAFCLPNYGYFGYPVIAGVFGDQILANFMIFAIPFSLVTSSFGYSLFVGGKKIPIRKVLLTPMFISLVIGLALGLTGIQLPDFLNSALTATGNCMSPCSMLLAGFMLGKFPLKQLLTGWRPYVYTAIRLLGIPLIFGSVLMLLGIKGQYLLLPMLMVGLPLGLNLVVYPESQGYEKEASDNAKLCFVSYLLAVAVLPFTFSIVSSLA